MIIEILLWAVLPSILISLYIAKKDLFPEPKAAIVSSIGLGFLIFIPHTLFFQVWNYYWAIYDITIMMRFYKFTREFCSSICRGVI